MFIAVVMNICHGDDMLVGYSNTSTPCGAGAGILHLRLFSSSTTLFCLVMPVLGIVARGGALSAPWLRTAFVVAFCTSQLHGSFKAGRI